MATALATGGRPAVLVVDDLPEMRYLLRRLLERAGMSVAEAATGEDAMREIERRRPDLVVLDIGLPGISGLEVARRVRAHAEPAVAGTILLACSASAEPDIARRAIDAGCDAFEAKPVDVGGFADRVLEVMAARHPA